ncbi:MAG TPA: methyltransferase domain-containing protein, partial [Candidatus Saccharimonadia bacterium]|nr:methyltransferase domain-containing protein [Candidatus Saccharimonadia bacterium]
MNLPFVSKKRLNTEVQQQKERLSQAKEATEKAKAAVLKHKKTIQELRNRQEVLMDIAESAAGHAEDPIAQITGKQDLRSLFARRLSGEGIGIGALHRPLPVPPGATVKYVDINTREKNIAKFPELDPKEIVETTYVCDGQTLSAVPDESQDFVIANHMLEHCVNPLRALQNFLRVLRPMGRMFISLPDKRFTFDYKRGITPWPHILEDFQNGREFEDRSVYEEFRDLVDPKFDVEAAMMDHRDIHHHTWTQGEILELIVELRRTLGWHVELELFAKQGCEVVMVLQKADPVHEDHAATSKSETQVGVAATKEMTSPDDESDSSEGTRHPSKAVPSMVAAAMSYFPNAWATGGAHMQIEESWSADAMLGIKGFILVKEGRPEDTALTCHGSPPLHVQWIERPEVCNSAVARDYAKNTKCGFIAWFRRRARDVVSITLPLAAGGERKTVLVPATGRPPALPLEKGGIHLTKFAEMVNSECSSVLEIGSRIVSPGSASKRSLFAPQVKFTGFDYYKDDNTDVAGDAHQLSSYFPQGTKFDAVFSVAVLEHIAMPWVVAMEISKLLAVGGIAYHATPFAWPLHETPWDFWRYSHEGL